MADRWAKDTVRSAGNTTRSPTKAGSHAEERDTLADQGNSHAEEYDTLGDKGSSHAEKHDTLAVRYDTHADKYDTVAGRYDTVAGKHDTVAGRHDTVGEHGDMRAEKRASHARETMRLVCKAQGNRRSSTSIRRPGPFDGGNAKNALPTSPEKLPPLSAKTSPCRPSWMSSRVTRAVIRIRVTAPCAVNARPVPRSASVRSIPRRRALDGAPPIEVRARCPSSSRTSVMSVELTDPNEAADQTGSALAACGKARVKVVARSDANRTPTAPNWAV